MRKRAAKLLLLLFCFTILLNSHGFGQTQAEIVRGLERLNRELEFTKELVRSFNSSRAQQLVVQAEQLRDEAVAAAHNNRPQIAVNKAKAAFALLEQAQRVTLQGPVNRWRSRLEELLRRADHEVLGRNFKEAERVLRKAKENRDAAERSIQRKHYRAALEHYQVAVQWAERAVDLVKSSDSSDEILQARHRFELLRQRAQHAIEESGGTRAKRIYDQAVKMFRSAERSLNTGNQQTAKRLYNQSILLLLRAIDLSRGDAPASRHQVGVALNRLKELVDNTKESLRGTKRPGARRLFERGRTYALEARAAADQGKNEQALWKIELAKNMLQRARRVAGDHSRPKISTRISQEIAKTQEEIAEVRSEINAQAPRDAEVLLNMSKFALSKAEQAAANGFDRVALESILAAQRFLTKAEKVLQKREASGVAPARLEIRIRQLDAAIAEAEDLIGAENQNWNRRLLQGAKDIRRMSIESKDKGNYRAADEGIKVAFELVRKSLKNVPRN